MSEHPAAQWAREQLQAGSFRQNEVDCTTTVVLKILDNKCKMGEGEKRAIVEIYHVVGPGDEGIFNADNHQIIQRMLTDPDEQVTAEIHRLRVHGETCIPKPVMKTYKAFLRNGLFGE